MAKVIGPKTRLIRDAITANPNKGNTELAEHLNGSDARKDDKIKVTAQDVAQQRQALKKMGPAPAAKPKKKLGRPKGSKPAVPAAAKATPAPAKAASPLDVIEGVFGLAEQVGGMGELKRLVDRLAGR